MVSPERHDPIEVAQAFHAELDNHARTDYKRLQIVAGIVLFSSIIAPVHSALTSSSTADQENISPMKTTTALAPCRTDTPSDIAAVEMLLANPLAPVSERSAKLLTYYEPADFMDFSKTFDERTFEGFMSHFKKFFDKYGVTVRPVKQAEVDANKDFNLTVPTADQLNSETGRMNVIAIANGLTELPVEYVKEIGFTTALLSSGITLKDTKVGITAFAKTDGNHDTIFFNSLIDKPNASTFLHEFGHLTDASNCGGPIASANDPKFISYNVGDIYFANKADRVVNRMRQSLPPTSTDWYENGEIKSVSLPSNKLTCKQKTTLVASIETVTDYGFQNEVEDKAEEYSRLHDPVLFDTIVDDRMPRLRAKAVLLLSRIYRQNPQFAKDLIVRAVQNEWFTKTICD